MSDPEDKPPWDASDEDRRLRRFDSAVGWIEVALTIGAVYLVMTLIVGPVSGWVGRQTRDLLETTEPSLPTDATDPLGLMR